MSNPYESDSPTTITDTADLVVLSELVNKQISLEVEIETLEEVIKSKKEAHKLVSTQQIPDFLKQFNLSELRLANGRKVVISPFYSGKVPDGRWAEAYDWLKQNDCDAIVKTGLVIEFGKGEDTLAAAAESLLIEKGIDFNKKQGIHPQTLKAFIKDRIESGSEIPQDLFGVFVGSVTKIK